MERNPKANKGSEKQEKEAKGRQEMSHDFLRCVFLTQEMEANAVKNFAKVRFSDVLWFFHLLSRSILPSMQSKQFGATTCHSPERVIECFNFNDATLMSET